MQQIIKILAAITFLMVFVSCNEEVLPPEPAPEFAIEGFTVPLRLNVAKPRDYNIAFRVTHPEGSAAIGDVTVTFFGSDRVTELMQFPLYDDGGFVHPDDRDVIAGDGIFTNHFISDSLVFPLGDVFMQVRAVDNAQNSIQTDLLGALALINAAPKVLSAAVPDTLFSGSQPLLFSVAVQDSNDIEDVTSVIMRLKRDGSEISSAFLEFQSKTAPDSGVFGAFFDSTFAAERDSLYTLEFSAVDLSDDVSNVLTKPILLENKAPFLYEIEMPDSLKLPSQGLESAFVTIHCNDPQSLADVDSVYFFSLKPDSTFANNGNPLPMVDNGLPFNPSNPFVETGDLVANDGIYSLTIFLDATALTGRYVFSFFARDKVGNLTAGPVDSLIVFQ
jgi:hypothetical protein